MPLHELGHVELDQVVFRVEEVLGKGPRELGLSDSSRAEEDERSDRATGILESRARPADCLRDGLDRLVLTDHPLVQLVFHAQQPRRLFLDQARDGNPGPCGHDLRDVLLTDLGDGLPELVAPRRFLEGELVLQLLDLVANTGRGLEVLLVDRVVLVRALLLDLLLELLELVGCGRQLHAHAR